MSLADLFARIASILRAPRAAPLPATVAAPARDTPAPAAPLVLLDRVLTLDVLAAGMEISNDRAAQWVAPIDAAMAHWAINTPQRQAAFLAQIGHESARLLYVAEIWGPTLAQRAYEPPSAKATDLGNTQPGDGSKYRGHGLIQITGRANHLACGEALGLDLIGHPELLEQPDNAAMSAGWFWSTHGCNAYADSGDFIGLTKRINGGTNGLADRQELWGNFKTQLGVS